MKTASRSASSPTVKRLAYVGLHGNARAWTSFAEVLGMQSHESEGEILHLRLDEWQRRVTIVPGDGGLAFVGWEVGDAAALEALAGRVQAAGISVEEVTDARGARGVTRALRFVDPAGVVTELCYAPVVDRVRPFRSPRGSTFVTGDRGLGHLVVDVEDPDRLSAFYETTLGFRVSDLARGPRHVTFLGCNRRHHSIAIGCQVSPGPVRLSHVMFEVADLATLGRAYDECLEGAAVRFSLGTHWNDGMTSFYVSSPSGCLVELGWGGPDIDPARQAPVAGTDVASIWGHHPIDSEAARG